MGRRGSSPLLQPSLPLAVLWVLLLVLLCHGGPCLCLPHPGASGFALSPGGSPGDAPLSSGPGVTGDSAEGVLLALASSSEQDKRAAFSPWAGKRDSGEKRAAFNSWAGKRDFEDKRAAFNSWAGKRDDEDKRAAFSPWAGKRDDDDDDDDGKRAAFNSWAGKREAEADKRAAFSPWAGKRDSDSDDKRAAFNSWAGKRAPFQPWAGKRAPFNSWAGKRAAFNSWAGKRDLDGKRAAFNSWAGKRSPEDDKRAAFNSWAGKRAAAFSPWAGKRDFESLPEVFATSDYSGEASKRAAFNSWAGKRAAFNSWAGKRAAFNSWAGKRAAFNSWAGKRTSGEDLFSDPQLKRAAFHAWAGKRMYDPSEEGEDVLKRAAFNSWAGKRAPGEEQRLSHMHKRASPPLTPGEKRAFGPWAGKRGSGLSEGSEAGGDKRAFHAWAGKRADSSRGESDSIQGLTNSASKTSSQKAEGKHKSGEEVDIQRHSSDGRLAESPGPLPVRYEADGPLAPADEEEVNGGEAAHPHSIRKRAAFSAWAGKRLADSEEREEKRAFSPWAGKRGYPSSYSSGPFLPGKNAPAGGEGDSAEAFLGGEDVNVEKRGASKSTKDYMEALKLLSSTLEEFLRKELHWRPRYRRRDGSVRYFAPWAGK